jgi:hypothetical protein
MRTSVTLPHSLHTFFFGAACAAMPVVPAASSMAIITLQSFICPPGKLGGQYRAASRVADGRVTDSCLPSIDRGRADALREARSFVGKLSESSAHL